MKSNIKNTSKECVWVINQFAGTPESGWGERHYYLSENWIKEGIDVNIFSGSFNHMFSKLPETNGKYTFQEKEARKFCWVKVPVYNPKTIARFWSMLVFAWRVLFIPIKYVKKPTVIIVSSMPIFPIITAYILKKRYKAKTLIFEIRDLWPLTAIHLGGISKFHPFVQLMFLIERFGYRKSDFIVSLLPNSFEYINPISKKPEKFRYIPNGLSADVLEEDQLEHDIIELIPEGKFIIGYAGTIGKANALEYFVEAAKLLKEELKIHFIIVGEGYLKEELIESARGYENITFIKKIRKNQVQSILSYFDVCFVGRNDSPLFSYGVSANKYFDYMLAGKPILDSNNFIKDPVELSGGGIIVKPDSSKAIVEGLMELYGMSKEELLEMGAKGKKYLKEFHNIQNLSNLYIQLFS